MNMTTPEPLSCYGECPAEELLQLLAGRWKARIFRLALEGPVRFNGLLRQLKGSTKQSVALALRELCEAGLLTKTVIKLKPLHIEYRLSDKGQAVVPVFRRLEQLRLSELQ
jgi:DNA-binding HxlR family transcriptional regulator